ncbi:hypothetical protein PFISCL1PPCAC_1263, partial [Pristionchus fissidentatus]
LQMLPLLLFVLLSLFSSSNAIECYSGSQLQMIECPSLSCIKQTLGYDTVRYCDGVGLSSICQTYNIFETCDTIPNLGFICCCSGNLCNSALTTSLISLPMVLIFLFILLR